MGFSYRYIQSLKILYKSIYENTFIEITANFEKILKCKKEGKKT